MKKIISCVLITFLLLSFSAHANEAADELISRGIISGDENGLREKDPVLRCEFAKMVCKCFKFNETNTTPVLKDVKENDWFFPYVSTLYEKGLMLGDEKKNFNPNEQISRAEAATLIGRLIGKSENRLTFNDSEKIYDWAYKYISKLYDLKLIAGSDQNCFLPDDSITREECFILFNRIINKEFESGNGSEENPYVINEAYQFLNIRNYPNANFKLEKDIDFSDAYFEIIENFGGKAEGNDHRIVFPENEEYLFENVEKSGVISNLILVSPNDSCKVAHKNSGRLENCRNAKEISYSGEENLTDFSGGNGSEENPYRIVSPLQFTNIKKYPNACYVLLNDIDFFVMYKDAFPSIENFGGEFNGNNHKISGVGVNPLFKKNGGTIKNLTVENSSIVNKEASAFVYENNGCIERCLNKAKISGENAAAFCINNNGKITECANLGRVEGSLVSCGISCFGNGEIQNSVNAFEVVGTGENSSVCGISKEGKAENCVSYGDLFFAGSIGTVCPISPSEYENSYFYNRYESEAEGGLTFKDIVEKKYSLDFENVFDYAEHNFPVLKNVSFEGAVFPKSFEQGEGTKENPFILKTVNDIFDIRMYNDAYFSLARDINFDSVSKEASIINNGGLGFYPMEKFEGEISGNSYTLYNFKLKDMNCERLGLFRINNGSINNLTISDWVVEGKRNVGTVCGENEGSIFGVSVRSSRIGSESDNSGAIAGINSKKGSIMQCSSNSDVFSSVSAGGICGINNGALGNCSNSGGVVANSISSNCSAGGICAINNSLVERSYNKGKVLICSDDGFAVCGGITGLSNGNILNCYNIGEQAGKTSYLCYVGGILGYSSSSSVSYCYNMGYSSSTSETAKIGSIIGGGTSVKAAYCYYDETLTRPSGEISLNAGGCISLSPSDMEDMNSFVGFKSQNIWYISEESGYLYPQIKSNYNVVAIGDDNIRDFAGGNGSLENPYKIMTPQQLNNVRKYLGSTFVLLNDIDMKSYCKNNDFKPIGENYFGFFGTFIGNGYKISNLSFKNGTESGLFGKNNGEIYNLCLENVQFSGNINGGIAVENTGLIYCCSVICNGEIKGETLMFGAVASTNKSSGMIISCYGEGSMNFSGNNVYAGGIVYNNLGIVAGSYNNMELFNNSNGFSMIGGISGYNNGTVSDCANYCNIISNVEKESIAGGICASLSGSIVNAICTANKITAIKSGGICGIITNGEISNCYFREELQKACSSNAQADATMLSNENLMKKESYEDMDFESMWYITDGEYPVLVEAITGGKY